MLMLVTANCKNAHEFEYCNAWRHDKCLFLPIMLFSRDFNSKTYLSTTALFYDCWRLAGHLEHILLVTVHWPNSGNTFLCFMSAYHIAREESWPTVCVTDCCVLMPGGETIWCVEKLEQRRSDILRREMLQTKNMAQVSMRLRWYLMKFSTIMICLVRERNERTWYIDVTRNLRITTSDGE